MNHMMCNPLFGKQESQESIQEPQNQAKIPKDSDRTYIRPFCDKILTTIFILLSTWLLIISFTATGYKFRINELATYIEVQLVLC